MPFLNVFKDNSGCKVNLKEPTTLLTVSRSLWYVQVTVEEISKILSSLDLYKGLGQENLPTLVVKECAEVLALSITAARNFSLREVYIYI